MGEHLLAFGAWKGLQPMITLDAGRALAERALVLFDATLDAHGLASALRPSLALAAVCYAAARQAGAAHPERAGRDAVLATPLEGLAPEQRCVVASAVAFQRAQPHRRREPAFLWLSTSAQTTALRLSALLMLADRLGALPATAFHLTGTAKMTTLRMTHAPVELATDGTVIERWRKTIGPFQLDIGPVAAPESTPEPPRTWELPSSWGTVTVPLALHATEPLAEGVRRVLRQQFERLLAREATVRNDEDIEEVHQLRVATRRLRASLQVVASAFDPSLIRRFRRGLRRIAADLGAVRDRDVFLDHLHHYQAALPTTAQDQLKRLLKVVTQDRAAARQHMLTSLEQARYVRFKHAFAAFLTTPGAGVAALPATGLPLRVRDAVGSLLWQRYEAVRAFEPILLAGEEEVQHQARIAGKHLRYTIECFAEVIGEPTERLLAPLAILQETLGALQDEVTARAYLATLHLTDDPGAQAYLAHRKAESATQLAVLPDHWAQVVGANYRSRFLVVLAAL